ncbi:MAG: hypothetical protein Q8Q14_08570, partial [Gemmatimonadales bacterium]|nr:hypothetical protein [Gemmatimonadales bacterium]
MARRGLLGGGLLGLVAVGGVAWWLLRRGRGAGAGGGFNLAQFADADMAAIFAAGLEAGFNVSRADDLEMVHSMLPPGGDTVKSLFAIPGISPPIQKLRSMSDPNTYDLYVDATLLPSTATAA